MTGGATLHRVQPIARRASRPRTAEERWVNSIFDPGPKIPLVEDIWDKEEEEEEEEEGEEEEEEEKEEIVDKEDEKEENRIKTLLGVPRQDSVWGLMAWPRPSPEQARWWEEFSLPPLRGSCLSQCRLRAKTKLHPLSSLASCSTSKMLPLLETKEEEPCWLRSQPLLEPPPASRLKIPKTVPRLPPKVSPKRSTVPKPGRQQTSLSMWPPIILDPPSKSSALKGQHTSSAKEAPHTLGAWGNPLPHLSSK
ncbi:histone H3.v1-like isoform X1 [Alexandromys fortis]|uniref:histone H3.v1-like isoform X1 n=1 Tax=Alexandromys fortis TaxID=100897 RepID=UPI0021536540|nr:histone H3.v1-like isoform X1 [Microtus fortis]